MREINVEVFPALLPEGKETLGEDDRGYIRIRNTVTGAFICGMRTYRTNLLLVINKSTDKVRSDSQNNPAVA